MKCSTLIVFLLYAAISVGQTQRNFTSYTVDNGLAQNTVWAAFQDYKGYMWFGTADGINRFDGYKMKHYKFSQKDSASIFGNSAFHFFETKAQQLWISHNKGISVYNRVLDNFYNIHLYTAGFHVTESYSTIIGEDEEGNVWCITNTKTLQCFSARTFKVLKTITLPDNEYRVLFGIPKFFITGKYIVGLFKYSSSSWFRINTQTLQVEKMAGKPGSSVCPLLVNNHTLGVYTDRQMHYFDIYTKQIRTCKTTGSIVPSDNGVFTSIVWWQGKLWMGNSTGIFVYDTTTNRFEEHLVSFDKREKVGFYYVQNLYVDHSDNLWICTNGDGVKCLSPQNNKFIQLPDLGGGSSLIKAITTDNDGNIYAGYYAGGMIGYLANGQTAKLTPVNVETNVLGTTVHRGYLYYIQNTDFVVQDLRSRKIVYQESVLRGQLQKSVSYPFFKVYGNKVYLITDFSMFEVMPDFSLRLIQLFEPNKHFLCCLEMINDSLCCLGTTKGVYMFNLATKQIKPWPVFMYMKSICLSRDGQNIWAGGNGGLYRLTTSGKVIQRYESPDDMPDDFVYGILEDEEGKLWVSHNKGISVYNPATKTFKHYSVRDGLQSNEFNTGAYHKDGKGLLYFGGVNGINIINSKQIIQNTYAPAVAINQILLGDLPYKTDTAYDEITQLKLSYLENTLSFDFSALEFSQPENNTFQYRLTNYDNNWIQSGTKHFTRYANLPPGNYVFEVMAANGDGVWSKAPKQIYISITPPFWQRTWFYMLTGLLVLSLIALGVYYYNKRQQEKLKRELEVQHKLEQERIRISRDLHDNVGAQLSYLITNIDWILQHPEQISKAEEQKRLRTLSETGRNAILTLRQTIWAISSTSLSVDDFADRYKQFAIKMLEFDKRIQLTFEEQITTGAMLTRLLR